MSLKARRADEVQTPGSGDDFAFVPVVGPGLALVAMISTAHRVEYALGYLALGLNKQAAAELDAVAPEDQFSPRVMEARVLLHPAGENWAGVAKFARRLVEVDRDDVGAWISLGCAVRRIESVEAARALLLQIESRLGARHAVIPYNLACYHCLLGDLGTAKDCLAKACELEAGYKEAALRDPDLERLWAYIAALA